MIGTIAPLISLAPCFHALHLIHYGYRDMTASLLAGSRVDMGWNHYVYSPIEFNINHTMYTYPYISTLLVLQWHSVAHTETPASISATQTPCLLQLRYHPLGTQRPASCGRHWDPGKPRRSDGMVSRRDTMQSSGISAPWDATRTSLET